MMISSMASIRPPKLSLQDKLKMSFSMLSQDPFSFEQMPTTLSINLILDSIKLILMFHMVP